MKKWWVIIVLVLYLIPASGMGIKAHYCCGKLKSISLAIASSDCCCGLAKVKSKCCQDKIVLIKAMDSQLITAVASSGVVALSPLAASPLLHRPSPLSIDLEGYFTQPDGPPHLPLFLRCRSIRV